jgi:hypothetical protein
MGRGNADAVERMVEKQQMTPAERSVAEESVEDRQADSAVAERLGGIDPERLIEEEQPPRD